MKKLLAAVGLTILASNALADGNQVFFRYGFSSLTRSRADQTFTDVRDAYSVGENSGKSGSGLGAGLDLKLMNCPLREENALLGEIFVDYNKFSQKKVRNAIGTVSGLPPYESKVTVSELSVVVAPKYQFGFGKFRPWIIPAGMAFLVNSPPSNNTSYLDIGYHGGVGLDFMVLKQLSLGLDYRYTTGRGDPGWAAQYSSFGLYAGVNF